MWHVWVLMGKPERREHLQVLSIFGLTVLEWDVMKGSGKPPVGFIWLSIGTVGSCCTRGIELSRFHKMLRIS